MTTLEAVALPRERIEPFPKGVKGTAPSMTPDLAAIIEGVKRELPEVEWRQTWVSHTADDDGIWEFRLPGTSWMCGQVSIESSYGLCPFLVETTKHSGRQLAETAADTVETIVSWLRRPGMRSFQSSAEFFAFVEALMDTLRGGGHAQAAGDLLEGYRCINGLTDGWADFLEAVEMVQAEQAARLEPDDRTDLETIRAVAHKAVHRR